MKTKTYLLLSLFLLMVCGGVSAKDVYRIWPVPQQQTAKGGSVDITARATIVAGPRIDIYTLDRARQVLTEHGITPVVAKKPAKDNMNIILGVNNAKDLADKTVTALKLDRGVFDKPKFDRHILSISKEGNGAQIVILGENTDAVFCGLASLEQILDSHKQSLKEVVINDWADTQYRGVIEGYYGVPYSQEVTEDLFRFMARYKMNTYMYGAKSDPYHSGYWDKPYPETITQQQKEIGYLSQDMLKSMTNVAHQCKVNFIWAIHPGAAFTDAKQTDVLDRIMKKFEDMHTLGVRQFGVFVDDVGVPYDEPTLKLNAGRLSELQQLMDKKWNGKKVNPADTVKPLHFVPQLYAYSWTSKENGKKFFSSLSNVPAKVCIYITGRAVWTVPNSEDPAVVSSWLGRDVAWWWNYPCNDNDMDKLFPLDMYRNFSDEAHIDRNARLEKGLKGVNNLISNPMQQGEISKIALFSVGDYAWNRAAFDNDRSWMAALKSIFGKKQGAAFKLLPYISTYDQSTRLSDLIRQFKSMPRNEKRRSQLIGELTRISQAADTLAAMASSANVSDRLFWHELQPFAAKVKDMSNLAIILTKAVNGKEVVNQQEVDAAVNLVKGLDKNEKYQFNVLNGMGTGIKLSKRDANPSAKEFRPFLAWLVEQVSSK